MRIGFIGAGRIAAALAAGLHECGYQVVSVSDIDISQAKSLAGRIDDCTAYGFPSEAAGEADLVFLATPDDAIVEADAAIAWRAGQWAVHCSGALPASILRNAASCGAHTGSLHPLQTFRGGPEDSGSRLSGITYTVEADNAELYSALEEMAGRLGGTPLRIAGRDKLLYHAGAVIAGNYSLALLEAAIRLWEAIGLEPETSCRHLMPLVRSTLDNAESAGLEASLTGPIARGDTTIVAKHIAEIGERAPELLKLYAVCGKLTLSLARKQLSAKVVAELSRMLDDAERNTL